MGKKAWLVLAMAVTAALLFSFPDAGLTQSAENTGINKRDASPNELTAEQQGESKEDREITRKIRRAVVEDKSLSTNAHNVKIITNGGMVTLKGPVKNEEEKRAIEEKALQIAGQGKVRNQIDLSTDRKPQ